MTPRQVIGSLICLAGVLLFAYLMYKYRNADPMGLANTREYVEKITALIVAIAGAFVGWL